jgi:cytochrome bd-type quinol oxidase subunit 2
VTVQNARFAGSVLDIVRPLPLLSGITLPFGYAVLGGGWLKLKSSLSIQHFATRSIRVAAPAFAVLLGTLPCSGHNPAGVRPWASHPWLSLVCWLVHWRLER